jgi:hypothetical protein
VGRKIDAAHLVGTAEIAARLGLAQPETVHAWRRRHADFPTPVARLRIGFVWYWPDVERWARANGRLPSSRRQS